MKNIPKYLVFVVSMTLSCASKAEQTRLCRYDAALESAINMAAYQQCVSDLHQCSNQGPVPDEKCVADKMKHPACQQMSALSRVIDIDPQMISIEKIAAFSKIRIFCVLTAVL